MSQFLEIFGLWNLGEICHVIMIFFRHTATPEKCHSTTLRNPELVHLIEVILFHHQKGGWL